jgi:SAM-dependent methyltransferase
MLADAIHPNEDRREEARGMPTTVPLYATAYGHFAEGPLAEVRRATYGEDFGQSSWVTADEFRRFIGLLGLTTRDHVLDVGSGSGGPALFLAREVGCRVTGIDIDPAGLETGRGLAREARLAGRVAFRKADATTRLPYASGSFDAIVCLDAVCHMPGRGRLFGEWFRLLRPGGRVLVTDPVVVVGPVSKEEFAVRSSTGPFEFCTTGVNERLLAEAGFVSISGEDATANEVEVSRRWHDARKARRAALVKIEGAETFAGLQRFLDVAHRLTAERRLVRVVYRAVRPSTGSVP